jgi:hypothetical protein
VSVGPLGIGHWTEFRVQIGKVRLEAGDLVEPVEFVSNRAASEE